MKLKQHIKGIVGRLLGILFPQKRALVERYATIPWHYKPGFSRTEQWIRHGLFYSISGSGSNAQLSDIHQNFWKQQQGSEYYQNTKNRFQETFIPHFSTFVDELDKHLENTEIVNICEIGTGDGQLLAYLAQRWPDKHLIGIDLSSDQIALNQQNYQQENLSFAAGDAFELIANQEPKATLYITGLGVLEYFPYDKLIGLLSTISSKHSSNMLFLTEPVYGDVDMSQDFDSYVYGNEQSFTHAYPKLLEREGWSLLLNDGVSALDHYFWVGIAELKQAS